MDFGFGVKAVSFARLITSSHRFSASSCSSADLEINHFNGHISHCSEHPSGLSLLIQHKPRLFLFGRDLLVTFTDRIVVLDEVGNRGMGIRGRI